MANETQAVVQLNNISVQFKDQTKTITAVNDVSLAVENGDIFGIIGYSGAGKSTLVRVINLLQRPTEGEVVINGQNLLQLNPKELRTERKKIGMIFQQFNLMESRTVFNNVEYPLLHTGISKAERQAKVKKLLERVELTDFAQSYPNQLSGGQKQRVAIARALANDPDVLISDEATSALDPKTTTAILKLLQELNHELGLTVILITHEMNVIKTICHNVAVIEAGKIIESGSVTDVFTNPQQDLTKDFVDSATNIQHALETISAEADQLGLDDQNRLVQLRFVGNSSKESLISELARDYHVDANILFANVDQIDGTNVGYMIAVLSGPKVAVDEGIEILQQNGVDVKAVDLSKIEGEVHG